jgi:hypothetical protein
MGGSVAALGDVGVRMVRPTADALAFRRVESG